MIASQKIPHLMKYMGSKREILEFITNTIHNLNIESENFCDLFSGTSVIGSSLRDEFHTYINDIQNYSSIFANTYKLNLNELVNIAIINDIYEQATSFVNEFLNLYPELIFDYSSVRTFEEVKKLEEKQQLLLKKDFHIGFHLFVQYYSGTYWSFDQCLWIDSIRAIAEKYKGQPEYYVILSSLIYAMSYTSPSTGHFAQFRDVTKTNMNDIMLYRTREIWPYFEKKFKELLKVSDIAPTRRSIITSLNYIDCLRIIPDNTIVYADPPYSSVHYSRFYHAIETLVKYDYPLIQYKGRYREDRHASPFGKKTEVKKAFQSMFEKIKIKNSHLILSYSDNGMITQKEIEQIGSSIFGNNYRYDIQTKEYNHSKMGRSDEHSMEVNELIMSFKRI